MDTKESLSHFFYRHLMCMSNLFAISFLLVTKCPCRSKTTLTFNSYTAMGTLWLGGLLQDETDNHTIKSTNISEKSKNMQIRMTYLLVYP